MGLKLLPAWIENLGARHLEEEAVLLREVGTEEESSCVAGEVRVLVVDDDGCDRDLTIRCLKKAWPVGGRVILDIAEDGAQALELLRRERYVLLILDWNMPRQSGADVMRAMQKLGLHVPVVVVSGEWKEDILLDWQEAGADFLSKNELDSDLLRQAIWNVMLMNVGRCSVAAR